MYIIKPFRIALRNPYFQFASKIQSINRPDATNLIDYYCQLLQSNPINQNGILKFQESHISTYIHQTNQENIKDAIYGFNNILGHNAHVSLKFFDRFILKCIQFNEIDYTLDVYQHHIALRYFPSEANTLELIKKCTDEQLTRLLTIVNGINHKFIKLSATHLEHSLRDNPKISYLVFRLAVARQIQLSAKSLYLISRNFINQEELKGVDQMNTLVQPYISNPYAQLSLMFTQLYSKSSDQAIVALAKLISTPEGVAVAKKEMTHVAPILDKLKEAVAEDQVWSDRLQELIVKVQ